MSSDPQKPELPSDADIEARFSKIKENLTVDLDDVDDRLDGILSNTKAPKIETDEFDEKLHALEAKAQAMKQRRESQKVQAEKEIKSVQDANQGLGMGMTIAYTIIGMPLVGGFLGLLLNKATGGTAWLPLCAMIGMFGGLGVAIYLLYKKND